MHPHLVQDSLVHPLSIPNGISIGRAIFAELTAESLYLTMGRHSLPSKLLPRVGYLDHHLIHASLGSCEFTYQTACRSVKFHQVDTKTNTTKNNILFIDFTRGENTRAGSICNKSAITDHVCNENHVIDWANAKVIDRESDKAGRLIREAIWIRKTDNMNRDEGSYQLSHVWDKLLHTDDRHRKSVLMKASDVKPKRR